MISLLCRNPEAVSFSIVCEAEDIAYIQKIDEYQGWNGCPNLSKVLCRLDGVLDVKYENDKMVIVVAYGVAQYAKFWDKVQKEMDLYISSYGNKFNS